MYGMTYTAEMKQFIFHNYKGITSQELADKFFERFGIVVTSGQMKSFRGNHKLVNGVDCRFKKGDKPHNAGKKGIIFPGSEKGWYKKGHIPQNYRPIGSERITKDGYIEIKVADPSKWRLKHNVIWENKNGDIPNGCVIVFLDGDKTNCDIDNLKLIQRSELLIMNRYKLFKYDVEMTKTAINIAKLINIQNSLQGKRGVKK